jgi:F-type H+-transporting ATPase subunit b
MLIDWFTVAAQALNFIILVWLLKRFLYRPILNAVGAREKLIADELANADARKAEAQKERDDYQRRNAAFDKERAALMSKATDDAKSERQRLMDEARNAADAVSAKRQETLRGDARSQSQAIVRRTQDEVFAIARKTLTDLGGTSLEDRIGAVFSQRLRALDGAAKQSLGDALKSSSEPAILRGAFDMPAEQRAAIGNAINETFSADIHIRFETAPDLIGGIELIANGQKLAWSIADYLAAMEKAVRDLTDITDAPKAGPASSIETPKQAKAA